MKRSEVMNLSKAFKIYDDFIKNKNKEKFCEKCKKHINPLLLCECPESLEKINKSNIEFKKALDYIKHKI